jgi:hypothetical protein
LNVSSGDTLSERFKEVRFDDVVERAAKLDGTGLLTKLMTTISADPDGVDEKESSLSGAQAR